MMVKNRLFATVAVLGVLSAIAQQSIKLQRAIASSVPSSSLAKAPTQPHHSVPNGFEFIPLEDSQGRGTLKIINGTTKDAAVKLIDNSSKKTRRFVYVQANHEVLLKKIRPCSCSIRFTLGKDWDKKTQKFLQNPSFSQFLEPLDFSESGTFGSTFASYKVWFHNYTITLHSVPFGNAQTAPLSESNF